MKYKVLKRLVGQQYFIVMIFGHYDPNTLIIGASVAGLAAAASLQKLAIEYTIIEKHGQTATPWRNHYNRLHLHTNQHL